MHTGFTLVELVVVIGIIIVLLGLVVPAVTDMWEERKGAETETMLRGLLASTRTQAINDKQRGLLFALEGDVQRVYPIEAEPPDPKDYNGGVPGQIPDDVRYNVTVEMTANRFRISAGKPYTVAKPYRVAPLGVVNTWSAPEVNNEVYNDAGTTNSTLNIHRNFFTMVFSKDGQLRVGRDVLIHDPDSFLTPTDTDGFGDSAGLAVSDPVNWYNAPGTAAPIDPVNNSPLPQMLVSDSGVALNFRSVAGLLVYDETAMQTYTDAGSGRQDFLIETGQPYYVARLSGQVITGPKGENE